MSVPGCPPSCGGISKRLPKVRLLLCLPSSPYPLGEPEVQPAPSVLGCPPALSLASGSSQPLPTFIAAFPSPCGGWMWGMPLKQHTRCWGPKNSLFTRQILGGTLLAPAAILSAAERGSDAGLRRRGRRLE